MKLTQIDMGSGASKAKKEPEIPEGHGDFKKLHSACRWDKYDDVVALLKESHVDIADDKNGNRAVHIAAQNGNLRLLELLISKKCKVNAQNNKGQTALHMAIEYDYYPCVKKLLESGADPEVTNQDGHPAKLGIDGGKVLAMVQLTSEDQSDMKVALDALLGSPDSRAKIDKASLVQIRIKQKKENGAAWTDDIDKKFKELLGML